MPLNGCFLLTFDLEEFDLPVERGRTLDFETQLQVTCEGLSRLVPLLVSSRTPVTFFTTASFAAARPEVVRQLSEQGHEIAAHGLRHGDNYQQMKHGEVTATLRDARSVLESITQQPVRGFRAPRLQLTDPRLMQEAGFRYGASVHPTWVPGRYRAIRAPRRPWQEHGLVQVPISVVPGCRWPLSFWWFRAGGARLTTAGARLALADTGYLHLYFHPWEAMPIAEQGVPRWLALRSGVLFVGMMERLLEWARPLEPMTVSQYVSRIAPTLS